MSNFVQQRPLLAVMAVLLAFAGTTQSYRHRFEIQHFFENGRDGSIIVNSPTVYTRQRLVNDRLDQARWLRTQLEFTEEKREAEFKSIDAVRQVSTTTKGTLNIPRGDSSNSENAAKNSPNDPNKSNQSIEIDATTMAMFHAKNAYREEVRSEITQTELDDRHDIKGNTIYRLTFDASVIAGTNKEAVAAIIIRLGHDALNETSAIKDIYREDYQSLYENWASKFQDTIATSLTSVSESINSSSPQSHLRLLFSEFLLRRICQIVGNDIDLNKEPEACVPEHRAKAESLLALYTRMRLSTLQKIKDGAFNQALNGYRATLDSRGKNPAYIFPDTKNDNLIEAAAQICVRDSGSSNDQIALWQLGIIRAPQNEDPSKEGLPPASRETDRSSPTPNPQENAAVPTPKVISAQGDPQKNKATELIGCPFSDSLKERLISGVLLYEKIFSLMRNSPSEKQSSQTMPKGLPVSAPNSLTTSASPHNQAVHTVPSGWFETTNFRPPNDYESFARLAIADLGDCNNGACFVQSARLRCFAADFIRSNLNLFGDRSSRHNQKISDFLTLRIVGREVNDCSLIVMPYPERFEKAPLLPQGFSSSSEFDKFLSEFKKALNRNTDAFAYSVTPKNLAENVSTAADTRDAYELLIRAAGKPNDLASFLRTRSKQNRAVIAHPIVVGFGSSDRALVPAVPASSEDGASGVRDIDFGWIIAGRLTESGSFEQIDGQYPLSAYISVPGWWQTVKVSIVTCWLPRTTVARLTPVLSAGNVCSGEQRTPSMLPVRLPPAIAEISHKLGFDVVQQPSIFRPQRQELVIGRPGALLLEGQRLWRSTEVTAGAQHADKITVLPNMEGILAEFDCVEAPPGQRQPRGNDAVKEDRSQIVTESSVRVWTSEGATESIPLGFVWPKDSEITFIACPEKRKGQVKPTTILSAPQPR